MDVNEFLQYVEQYRKQNPQQRLGQAMFNILRTIDPDLANRVCGSTSDPFHNDDRIPDFLNYVFN